MTTRAITNPQVGDYWERPFWKQIIVFSEGDRVIILEKNKHQDDEHLWDTSLKQFRSLYSKNKEEYKFIGNHPEKASEFKTLSGVKMNNATLTTVKENLTGAITNPQAGDRWIWPDGVSIEVNDIRNFHGENELRVCYATNTRITNSQSMKGWRSFVHGATFVGNFAPKTEKRDPKKNPQAGDKWQTTIFYYNNMYDGTTKGITVGSMLMINEVANRESDIFVYGYFTDGTKFICPMKEFEARTQSFKFVE